MALTDESLRELNRLRAENAALRALLQAHDIKIPEVSSNAVPEESKDDSVIQKIIPERSAQFNSCPNKTLQNCSWIVYHWISTHLLTVLTKRV